MSAERASSRAGRSAATPRLALLAVVLAVECLVLAKLPHPWLHAQQPMAAPIVFAATLLFFGRRRLQSLDEPLDAISPGLLAVHLAGLCCMAGSVAVLMRLRVGTFFEWAAIAVWSLALVVLLASLVLAFVPLRQLVRLIKALGVAWAYAVVSTVAAMSARTVGRFVWDAPDSSVGRALQAATFRGVHALLSVFYSPVLEDPARVILGTSKFQVLIAGTCSGVEGLALMLAVGVGWLFYARRELRLQRAVWLVPVALGLMWVLNLVRISVLIALGDAGHADLALNGFHSEAGWIFFNAVAIGFLIAAQKIAWLRKGEAAIGGWALETSVESPISKSERSGAPAPAFVVAQAYLVPFLAITAVSLLTRALSSGFEVLYPVRVVVGVVVLWCFRRVYREVDWRFGWVGVVGGVVVFAVWLGVARWMTPSAAAVFAGDSLAAGLEFLTPWQRWLWLAARVLAAVFVVPVAEELAFRGYLARRVVSAEVATVPYARLGVVAVAVSAASFGVLGGRMFVGGIFAGVVFALVAKWRNRLGEAVAAHAVANLLLAVWVVARGEYWLW